VEAQLSVPAIGIAGAPLCGFIGGKWECVSVVQLSCPDKIQLVVEGTNQILDCPVECAPPTPDDEGRCECEVTQAGCTPAGG
jgi:hypothetical protein